MIIQYFYNFDFNFLSISIIALILLVFLNLPLISKIKHYQSVFGVTLFIFIFTIACSHVQVKNSLTQSNYFYKPHQSYYVFKINKQPIEKANSIEIRANVLKRNDTLTTGKTLFYIEKNSQSLNLKYGDILLSKVKFNRIQANGNPNEFNYKNYLRMFNIHHRAYIKKNAWVKIDYKPNIIFKYTFALSNYFTDLIDKTNLKPENKAIAKALLIGNKEDLDKNTLRNYSSAGAMHVLAVSGLHVGIIMLVLSFILKPIKQLKFGKSFYLLAILFGVWIYAFITGLSPSVVRSSIMFSFIIIGKELERDTNVYQSILVSAFILMLLDPLVIFKVGFQLSYLAVLGIVYLQPKIYNLFYINNLAFDYMWKISSVSLAAQIATFPLGMYYFNQFPNLFLISNLVVIPLAFFIMITGIVYFISHKIPLINNVTEFVLDNLLSLLNYSVDFTKNIPYSIWWGISINWIEALFIYIIVCFSVFAFTLKKGKFLIYAIAFSIVFFSSRLYRNYTINNSNQLVIYNINDELALDIFYGSNNLFICSDSLLADKNKVLFNIEHYWHYRKGAEHSSKIINIKKTYNKVFKLNNTTFSIINNKKNNVKYIPNYLIIGNVLITKKELKQLEKFNTKLIIHPICSKKTISFINQNYKKDLVYNIKKQGAFIFSF